MNVISRAEAKALGQGWYFTGKPCPRGHTAKRSVSTRECRGCVDAKKAAKRVEDPETARAKDRARHARTAEVRREQSRASYQRNIEARRAYERERYANPDRRAWQMEQALEWGRANPGKRNAMTAERRARQRLATPRWLTPERRRQILAIYVKARSYGPGVMHVDHIVPLAGETVCGLHVPENLQILPAAINVAKGNRFVAAV